MIILEVIAAALLLALGTGGSLRNLTKQELKGEWALLVLLPLQVSWSAISRLLGIGCGMSIALWLVMMAALVVVLVLNSRRQWGLVLAAVGIVANMIVIALNGAMPVSLMAAAEIGGTREDARAALVVDCLHNELDETSQIPILADVIAIPGPPWQRGVVSVGDLLLAGGLAAWVFAGCRSR